MGANKFLSLIIFLFCGFSAMAQIPVVQGTDNLLYQNSTTDGAHPVDSLLAYVTRNSSGGTVKTLVAPASLFSVSGNNTATVTLANALAAGYMKSQGSGSGFTSSATIPATDITGTLGVANGGTGATTLTGYVKGTGTSALTASSTIPFADLTGANLQAVTTVGATTTTQVTLSGGYVLAVATEITGTTGSIDGTKQIIPFNLGASNCTATITGSLVIGEPYKVAFKASAGGNLKITTSGSETINGNATATGWTITAARAKSIFILTKISSTEYVIQ